MSDHWIDAVKNPPAPGKYWVKYTRDGKPMEGCKVYRSNGVQGKWFGGCRPFCENDVVTHYKIELMSI